MGGTVKKALPLIALAAVGYATGGFGLAAGGGAAATAGAPLALTPLGGVGAGLGAVAPTATAASGGFFSSLAGMSTASKLGLGLQGLSAAGSMFGGDNQQALIDMQAGQQQLQASRNGLDLAQRQLASEKRLQKTISALNVRANAFGGDLSSGSGANLLDAAAFSAQGEQGILKTQQRLQADGVRSSAQTFAFKRRAAKSSRSGAALGSLFDFGISTASAVDRHNRIGRA